MHMNDNYLCREFLTLLSYMHAVWCFSNNEKLTWKLAIASSVTLLKNMKLRFVLGVPTALKNPFPTDWNHCVQSSKEYVALLFSMSMFNWKKVKWKAVKWKIPVIYSQINFPYFLQICEFSLLHSWLQLPNYDHYSPL